MSDHRDTMKLLEQAWSKRREGNYEEARALVKQAQEHCEDDDFNSLGRILHVSMQFESDHGNRPKALQLCQQSLDFYKKANNPDKIAHSTRHIADLQRELGHDALSEENYRYAVSLYRANPQTNTGDLANALRGFALILEKRSKTAESKESWEEARELYQSLGIQEGVDEANLRLSSFQL